MPNNAILSRFAAQQRGAFSVAQARRAGFDRSAVHRRILDGSWLRLHPSVYALASAPHGWEQRIWAAALSRDRALLTHWTACRIFGLPDVPNHLPTILVPRSANTRSESVRVFESDQFENIAVTEVDGLPVTTMPETILLLGRDVRARRLERVFDQALVMGILDLNAMSRTIDREAGRRTPGTPLLRRLVSTRRSSAPQASSTYLNRILEALLHDPHIPPWTREFEFSLDEAPYRVDVYVPSVRLVIEADGRNWHARWEKMESDRVRDNALAARGIQTLRFTYEMLTTRPEGCLEEIIATCRIRAA